MNLYALNKIASKYKGKTTKILRIKRQMDINASFTTMMQLLAGRIQQGKDT